MEQIINIHVEKLPEGVYLATSEDVLHYCQVVLEPTSPFTFFLVYNLYISRILPVDILVLIADIANG